MTVGPLLYFRAHFTFSFSSAMCLLPILAHGTASLVLFSTIFLLSDWIPKSARSSEFSVRLKHPYLVLCIGAASHYHWFFVFHSNIYSRTLAAERLSCSMSSSLCAYHDAGLREIAATSLVVICACPLRLVLITFNDRSLAFSSPKYVHWPTTEIFSIVNFHPNLRGFLRSLLHTIAANHLTLGEIFHLSARFFAVSTGI